MYLMLQNKGQKDSKILKNFEQFVLEVPSRQVCTSKVPNLNFGYIQKYRLISNLSIRFWHFLHSKKNRTKFSEYEKFLIYPI